MDSHQYIIQSLFGKFLSSGYYFFIIIFPSDLYPGFHIWSWNFQPSHEWGLHLCQFANRPPSIGRKDPWIMEAWSLSRNRTGPTTSDISENKCCFNAMNQLNSLKSMQIRRKIRCCTLLYKNKNTVKIAMDLSWSDCQCSDRNIYSRGILLSEPWHLVLWEI